MNVNDFFSIIKKRMSMDFILHLACDLISHGNRPTHPKIIRNQQTQSREVYIKKKGSLLTLKNSFKKTLSPKQSKQELTLLLCSSPFDILVNVYVYKNHIIIFGIIKVLRHSFLSTIFAFNQYLPLKKYELKLMQNYWQCWMNIHN